MGRRWCGGGVDVWRGRQVVIKCISGWWYLVNAGAFHGYPFPTKQDAAEALQALEAQA
jgi:hypothetical protein